MQQEEQQGHRQRGVELPDGTPVLPQAAPQARCVSYI
jgi:hypothetical protein